MMACAFGGFDLVMKAYETAKKEKYKFLTYGDAMLIVWFFQSADFHTQSQKQKGKNPTRYRDSVPRLGVLNANNAQSSTT